jgi:hypothetical protein
LENTGVYTNIMFISKKLVTKVRPDSGGQGRVRVVVLHMLIIFILVFPYKEINFLSPKQQSALKNLSVLFL